MNSDNKQEKRWRVLDLVVVDDVVMYRQRLFKREKDGTCRSAEMYTRRWTAGHIAHPGRAVRRGRSRTVDEPPLIGLVGMGWHHYRCRLIMSMGAISPGCRRRLCGVRSELEKAVHRLQSCRRVYRSRTAMPSTRKLTRLRTLRKTSMRKSPEMAVLGARMLENQKTAVRSAGH